MEDQKTRLTEQLQKEGETVDTLSADLRKKNQMVVELQQAIKDQQDAAKSAAELTQVNLRALPSELSSSSVASAATSAGTVSNELAVATSNTAPINMKFVGVLVGVNALLGCVAFTYYSESKKLQSFQATFLEEF